MIVSMTISKSNESLDGHVYPYDKNRERERERAKDYTYRVHVSHICTLYIVSQSKIHVLLEVFM